MAAVTAERRRAGAQCLVAAAALLTFLGDSRADPKPVSLDDALKTVSRIEEQIKVAQWKLDCCEGELVKPNDPSSFVKKDTRLLNRGHVIFEHQSGKYWFDRQTVGKRTRGTAPTIGVVQRHVYDGRSYSLFERSRPGTDIPGENDRPTRGEIHATDKYGLLGDHIFVTGAGLFPPYFEGLKLSEVIRSAKAGKREVTITDNGAIWTINASASADDEHLKHQWFEWRYDLKKGGLVVEAARRGSKEPGKGVWQKTHVEPQEVSKGVWVPKRVTVEYVLGKHAERVEFSDAKINPPVKEDTYTMQFPGGTFVTDYVKKIRYRVPPAS